MKIPLSLPFCQSVFTKRPTLPHTTMMRHTHGLAIGLLATLCSCSTKPYHTTNKVYKKQVKKFATTLQSEPGIEANDSIKAAAYFVGTTNFTMRKPNFVMIH